MSYQDTGITPEVEDITASLSSLQFKQPREEQGDQPPSKRANVSKSVDQVGSKNSNSFNRSNHNKAPPSNSSTQGNVSTGASAQQNKKFIKARRVLNNQQSNSSPPQQQQQQNKPQLPYQNEF